MNYRITPPEELIEATVELPLSKSYLARATVIDLLAGRTAARELSDRDRCDDVLRITAAAALPDGATADLGGSGTALRLLTAAVAAMPGRELTLTGDDSLLRRPMQPLVDALKQLGADIEYLGEEGHAPLRVRGRQLQGGSVTVDASQSSQYTSALMLIAPLMTDGLTVNLSGVAVSTPYLRLTARMMQRCGIEVELDRDSIEVKPGTYTALQGQPERDWTAASYWYEIVALSAGWITLPGLHADDLQGDRVLTDIFPRLGVLTDFEAEDDDGQPIDGALLSASPDGDSHINIDLGDYPDLAPTLAATAVALNMPFKFGGLAHLHHKESDRIATLRSELAKFGIELETDARGTLIWDGSRRPVYELPAIDTHNDHRIAMAFAPLALVVPGLVIRDIEVVAKSYPTYWHDLQQAGFVLEEV